MKLETPKQNIAIAGNFETTEFSVGDMGFLVDMFADKVYTNKVRAVVREYSGNAWDAMKLAGKCPTDFDVHVPTMLESWFSVRDYGHGLSDQEVRTIFAGVGVSTKRDSNDMIGCFGIGTLSAYSVADSFTVKSWHGGKCNTYSCYRDEQRRPVVALLTSVDSDEDTGIEVSVNISDNHTKYTIEAVEVFKWWDKTPNINKNSVVESCDDHRNSYLLRGKDYAVSNTFGDMYAVMGNIAYRIPDSVSNMRYGISGYIRLEIGAINFDTGRENMSLDDKSIKAVKDKIEEVKADISKEVVKQIEAEPTPFKRAVMAEKYMTGSISFLVDKNELKKFELPKPSEEITYWSRSYRTTSKSTTDRLPLGDANEYYLEKPRMTTRIKNYLKDSACRNVILLTDKQAAEVRIDRDALKDLDSLPKPVRIASSSRGSTARVFVFDPSYKYRGDAKDFYKECDLEIGKDEIVYVEISRYNPVDCSIYVNSNPALVDCVEFLKNKLKTNVKLYGIKTSFTKTKAFKQGNFISIKDFLRRELTKASKNMTKSYVFSDDQGYFEKLAKLFTSKEIDDVHASISVNTSPRAIMNACKLLGIELDKEEDDSPKRAVDAFFAKYPMVKLLMHVSQYAHKQNSETVADYINAKVK
jgi:hypothetical protein